MIAFEFDKPDGQKKWKVGYPDNAIRYHKNLRTALWYIVIYYLKPVATGLKHFVVRIDREGW